MRDLTTLFFNVRLPNRRSLTELFIDPYNIFFSKSLQEFFMNLCGGLFGMPQLIQVDNSVGFRLMGASFERV